ncbi:MAG: corrinoid protein [bacterium]|jgi:corrinoid protein of di/trimethylamine methyltransferase|nr:corrinoid protein [bacterium]
MGEYQSLYDAILKGDAEAAKAVTQQALAGNAEPMSLVTDYMVPAMDEVGRRFECEEFFIPELLIAARAMKGALELIRPKLAEKGTQMIGRVVIGTVKGDLHDIGKNLVGSMLEGGGFDVIDLGVDVSPQKFVDTLKANRTDIVCLSTLLTTTMPSMKETIETLKSAGVRDKVKVIVGGAPVTQEFAKEIGADAYGENARTAVTLARTFLSTN